MHFGIFTYGTRGDVQPYFPLAIALIEQGHKVTLAAPGNFSDMAASYGIEFHPLYGNVEEMMNKPEGRKVMEAVNSIALMKYFYKVLGEIREPLQKSYFEGISKVDAVIANQATLPVVSAICEKLEKKLALSYFMPPMAMTSAFPAQDMELLNFPLYNRLTYRIVYALYWSFVKKETNDFRMQLGLLPIRENLIDYIEKQQLLNLFCISPQLIARPADWKQHHHMTGFLTFSKKAIVQNKSKEDVELDNWLKEGKPPIYLGFGSNGVGDPKKVTGILQVILSSTNERILFCTGWAVYPDIPTHPNLFVRKYIDHDRILPSCRLAIFHGGAGTLATMLRHMLPVIVVSFYTDQPFWGRLVEKRKLGAHIPFKKLTAEKLLLAIRKVQEEGVRKHVLEVGKKINKEDGVKTALALIINYFSEKSFPVSAPG